GGIPARSGQAIDEAGTYRIGNDRKYDRHGARLLKQRRHRDAARGQNDVGRERDQLRRVFAITLGIAAAPSDLDPHIAAVGPAQFLKPLQKRRVAGLRVSIVRVEAIKHADTPQPPLLRARRQRPRRRAAKQRDELAPLHVWMAPAWQEKM